MDLCGNYPIMDGGRPVGELEVSPWGAYLRFRAVCRTSRQTVFRLLAADGGQRVSLGVMTPSGSGWSLDRRFSPADLRALGLHKLDACLLSGGETAVWQAENAPERLFQDETLKRVCRDMHRALSRRAGELTLLAVPLDPHQPFPAMPIFCFGEVEEIDGENYVVFAVRGGALTYQEPRAGHTTDGVS